MKRLTVVDAVEFLKQGQLVIVPTETVYGLAADGLNEEAIKSLYKIKNRPLNKPIMLQIADQAMLYQIAREVPDYARKIMDIYWPGPVSLIFKKQPQISTILTAGGDTIGVRMPKQKLTLQLIRLLGHPLAVPSANLSGEPSPKSAEEAIKLLEDWPIAGILDGGKCEYGIESTVVDCSTELPRILREGAVKKQEILGLF